MVEFTIYKFIEACLVSKPQNSTFATASEKVFI